MSTALITGITGQDGSYLAEQLHSRGVEVHALVRAESSAQEQSVAEWVTLHEGDLLRTESLRAAVTDAAPDYIFNLAGISSVAQSWKEPELTSRVTGLAVGSMLDAAWTLQESTGKPVRFVQASSSEIFGAAEQVPQNESTPIHPVSPYGAAKAYAHHLVGVYRSRGLFAASGILYNHESPRRPEAFVTRKITAGVAQIAAGTSSELLLGNLDAQRDWGWAPDYVDALVRIVEADVADDFVIATGESHTVREFVGAAFAAAGIADWENLVAVDERFNRPVDAPLMRGDSSKIRETLGWKPTKRFDEIVSAMVGHDLDLLSS
jgi:GDPmannose 4,6-dehydratase